MMVYPCIPALRRLKEMNHKIQISLGYIANFYLKGKRVIFQLCLKSILNLSQMHRFFKQTFRHYIFIYLMEGKVCTTVKVWRSEDKVSPSTMWALGIKLGLFGLVADAFTC